ncbi:HipA domain-containing protein [Planomonospora sp. ID82291]|uniref:HipA domain-containing protein n=1 Tax=Planomonospora sp. ID82291 TaxID=2738136 RepID=UPI0018C42316|nr:HipA domain-containing protein [Planomonospora sp. ID82291]MBG0816017.1 hypothetical protein [Planomonospora sp. ID82291]
MAETFPVADATDWAVDLYEADGSEEKIWLIEPVTRRRALFKPNVRHDNAEQADHWPEKLASEVAGLLGAPRALIDLATRDGRRGCLSYDVKPAYWQLQPGYVLLAELLGQHDPMDKRHEGHTLQNVRIVLQEYDHPPGFTGPGSFNAFDTFAGYTVFDALIANRDRHPANWAVLLGPDKGDQRLAPSYDHATSLGFSLTDADRERKLRDTMEWKAFLHKGTAWRFEGCRKVPLTDFAKNALNLVSPEVRGYWLDRLEACAKDQIEDLAALVPEMSEVARTFAVELVDANRRRLLDG